MVVFEGTDSPRPSRGSGGAAVPGGSAHLAPRQLQPTRGRAPPPVPTWLPPPLAPTFLPSKSPMKGNYFWLSKL